MRAIASRLLNLVNRVLQSLAGVTLLRDHSAYEWQICGRDGLSDPLQVGAGPDPKDPRLARLEQRYRNCDAQVVTPLVWEAHNVSADDVRNFRGDNAYIWQRIGLNANAIAYALSYYYLKSGSAADLLEKMEEDGAFGVRTISFDGRLISRDLLDSAGEIDFLRRHIGLGFRPLTLLDIGAGYGRLPHRLAETIGADALVFATDAFPASTYLSEHYLASRAPNAKVVPLDEFDDFLRSHRIDVATNVHSFSECRYEAIEWWVERLAAADVRYLMVVPNGDAAGGEVPSLSADGRDMEEIFARHGYVSLVREPRYRESLVQRYGLDPAQLNLFERRNRAYSLPR